MKYEHNIQDDKRNNIGTFINIRLNEEDIKNIEMYQKLFQKKDSNIIKNTLAITSEFLQIEKKNEKPDPINKKKNDNINQKDNNISNKIIIEDNKKNFYVLDNDYYNNIHDKKDEKNEKDNKEYEKDKYNKQTTIEFLNKIDSECKNIRKKIKDNKLDINDDITKYYLINSLWIQEQLNFENKINDENNIYKKETIRPTTKNYGISNINYPINFDFIKYESNEYIFNYLVKNENISEEDLFTYDIFFVYDTNYNTEKDKNLYIGVIDNNKKSKKKFIYFYLLEQNKFSIEFILNYNYEEIMIKEIKNNIMPKGVEAYLYEINLNFGKMKGNESFVLFDNGLAQIGTCFIINDRKKSEMKFPEYSKGLQNIKDSYYYNPILICLANILIIQKIFTNNNYLYENKIIEGTSIVKQFYKIIRNMWFLNDLQKESEISKELFDTIIELYGSNDIFRNSKQLIEFLITNMHNEIRTYNDKTKVKEKKLKLDENFYQDKKEIDKDFSPKNNSIFQKLFFFETRLTEHCVSCSHQMELFFINCILEFNISEILKKKDNNKSIKISDFFEDLIKKTKCFDCNSDITSKRQFNSCPQYLIIVIEQDNYYNFTFDYEKELNMKKHKTDTNRDSDMYDLISFVTSFPINDDKGIIFCKSPVNGDWYKYEGTKVEQKDINEYILLLTK